MTRLCERLSVRLDTIQREGRWKDQRICASGPSAHIDTADGRRRLLFMSNDYLALACHRDVVAASHAALDRYGTGTASARFVCGTTELHRTLERALAALCATQSALTFTSGWSANIGLLATLPEAGDLILSDALNHASLIEGSRLAAKGVSRVVLPHCDLQATDDALAAWKGPGLAYYVTDGVFSMEGSQAQIGELVAITRRHGAVLIVDDAHGIGVVGASGRGCAEAAGVLGEVDIVTGSLGKALGGVAGGFVAGPQELITLLEQTARAMLFTTALTPSAVAASYEAIRILRSQPEIVRELQQNVDCFVDACQDFRLHETRPQSAIVPLNVGESAKARYFARGLEERGIFASCFSHPVVPEGQARLRFQVSRAHTPDDLMYCAAACRSIFTS